ncbi:MAG: hypothetical protein ACFFBP_10210 [Promethearchaeota archaeon]
MKKKKNIKVNLYLVGFSCLFLIGMILNNFGLISLNNIDDSFGSNNHIFDNTLQNLKSSSQSSKEWLTNGGFTTTSDPWYNETLGDTSDVNASYENNHANLEVLGDMGNFTTEFGETYLNSSGEWVAVNNPQLPVLPILLNSFGGNSYDPSRQSYGTDQNNGLWCSHDYDNNVDEGRVYNSPSIHFKRNYTIGADLSDYQVTSVSLDVAINGTACSERPQGGGVEVPGDEVGGGWEYEVYDFVRYYVIISDTSEITKHEMGSFTTTYLGQDIDEYEYDGVWYDDLNNTILNTHDEDILIAFLTDVFENSGDSFTITLGIDIYCETNSDPDYDHWKNLSFTEFNFSFTYEKKMDRYASVSWNQQGNQLDGSKYVLDEAILNFNYQSNQNWPTYISPNSEIRVLINNRRHSEVIKLGQVNSTWQEAKSGGFDVTSILGTDENITLTIQLIIMDNFELNSTFTLSIDNVSLMIYYSPIPGEDIETDYELYINSNNRTDIPSQVVKLYENINITFVYKDTVGTFINGSNVQLTVGSDIKPLVENTTLEQYSVIFNSSELEIGQNFLPITASKTNYTSINFNIIITVNPLDTDIQLILNDQNATITKSIEVDYGEEINITAQYRDVENPPFKDITNATVTLTGYGTPVNLTEIFALNHYYITIDSKILGLGITYLLITAQKENYSSYTISFKIDVQPRNTFIANVLINNTEIQTFDIPWMEIFNISVSYNDTLTNASIPYATVQIQGSGYLANFTEDASKQLYYITINSTVLNIGVNYLTISAQKENYSVATQLVIITVSERETGLDIYLNNTMRTSIDIRWNENINITIIYKDLESNFLKNSDVNLQVGSTIIENFTEYSNQYSLILDTGGYDIGINTFTIYAKKENYTIATGTIIVNIFERETDLDTYLNQTLGVTIEISYGEVLNITVKYKDLNLTSYLNGANVNLKDGNIILYNFTNIQAFTHYNLTINTANLGLGVHALTIYAKLDNYSASIENILINVVERETELEIYLEGSLQSSIEIIHGELINITAIYLDKLIPAFFVDGANVSLREGTTIVNYFTKHPSLFQYNLTINSASLSLGFNILTINAKKDNYTVSLATISITVNERDTYFDIILNNENKTSEKTFTLSSGELLNITIYYRDSATGAYISSATLKLIGEGISALFNETGYFYNYTLDTELLDVGVSFLSVSANRENYTQISEVLTIIVMERQATYELLLNNLNKTIDRSIIVTVNQTLNITLYYKDLLNGTYLDNADITLYGGAINVTFIENQTYNFYTISINTSLLNQGVNFLNILAQKSNYESLAILLTISVEERQTDFILLLDQVDITNTPSKKIPVNQNMSFRVIYTDNQTGGFISNANIRLFGETLNFNFTEYASYYELNISAEVLNRGVNFLTVYLQRNNYEPHSLIVTIEVIDKPSDIQIFLDTLNKTQEKSIDIPIGSQLNVTIRYIENGTNTLINNAAISILGEGLEENLTYYQVLDFYMIFINTTELDIGIRLLTIIAEKDNYQTYSTVIRLNVKRIASIIKTTSGEPNVEVNVGISPRLEIVLSDLDFNTTVKNANVQYSWLYGTGTLQDSNNDGIYEVDLEQAPPGTYTVTITAYAGDNYDFERYQITVTISQPPSEPVDNTFLFTVLAITVSSLIGTSVYATLYQIRFKVPKQLRKLRKYRKTLKKPMGPGNVSITNRGSSITSQYEEKINKIQKNLKEKADIEEEPMLKEDIDIADPKQ